MQPRGNLVADTICRTADIGLTITGTADAGTLTIIDAPPRSLSRGTAPTAPNPGNCVITLSADWLTCRSWGFPPACTFVPPPDSPAPINNVGGQSSKPPSTAPMTEPSSPTG